MLTSEDIVQHLTTAIECLMSIVLFQELNTDSSFSSRRTISDLSHTHTHTLESHSGRIYICPPLQK